MLIYVHYKIKKKKINWNRWHDQSGTLFPGRPNVSLSHDLSLFPLDSQVNFSCVVQSPSPATVSLVFMPCDLRKPGDCDEERTGEEKLSQKCVSNSACHRTPCYHGVSPLMMKWHYFLISSNTVGVHESQHYYFLYLHHWSLI